MNLYLAALCVLLAGSLSGVFLWRRPGLALGGSSQAARMSKLSAAGAPARRPCRAALRMASRAA